MIQREKNKQTSHLLIIFFGKILTVALLREERREEREEREERRERREEKENIVTSTIFVLFHFVPFAL
jgi:hypothetical protein